MPRLEDLSPAARKRVLAAIARDEVAAARRPTVGDAPVSGSPARRGRPAGRWTCTKCDRREIFTSWAAAERHVDEAHGAGRLEVVLEVAP